MKLSKSNGNRPKPWLAAGLLALTTLSLSVLQACGDDAAKSAGGASAGEGGSAAAGAPSTGATEQGGSDAMAAGHANGDAGQTNPPSGDAGAGGVGSADGITIDEFCKLRARGREWLRQCRFGFGDSLGWWGAQNIDQFCSSGREAIEAGRLTYDPVQAQACFELSVGGCEDIEAFAFGVGVGQRGFLQSNACAGVVTGTVALDDECHSDSTRYASECAEGFCSQGVCPGVCSPYAGDGDDCDAVDSRCDPATAFCNSRSKCQAFAAIEETCSAAVPCAPGDLCHTELAAESGICVAVIEPGKTCDPALNQCQSGSICYKNKCAAKVPLGAACLGSINCPSDAYCDETCQAGLPVDEDCPKGFGCAPGLICVDLKCSLLGADGDDCPCQEGLWCDSTGTCQAPGALGDDCSQPDENAWQARCATPLVCVPSDVGASGPTGYECQPPGAVGDFCKPNYPGTCAYPAFCEPATFTCQSPAAENDACNYTLGLDSCQPGLYCACSSGCATPVTATAQCKPRLEADEDCVTWSDCLSGVCTGGKCAESLVCQ